MSKYNVPPICPLRLIFTTENHATLLRFLAMLLPCKLEGLGIAYILELITYFYTEILKGGKNGYDCFF